MGTDTSPLTARDQELLAMPSIASRMPIVFANTSRWTEFVCSCSGCGNELPPDVVRGSITRPLETVAVVEAIGVCIGCRLCTRFLYRLHADMYISGPRNGRWVTWAPRPRSSITRVLTILRRLTGSH